MTEDAPPPQHVPYAAPDATGRPTSVTTLAAIGIVIGSLMILCKPAGLFIQLAMPMPQPNPMVDVFRNDPTLRFFTLANGITGTLINVLLLMSSLGSLALKPWGRTGMLGYAALAVLLTAVNQVVGALIVGPEVERIMRQSGTPMPPGMAFMEGWVGVVISSILLLWYPVLILIFFTRPRAKRAFEAGLPRRDI